MLLDPLPVDTVHAAVGFVEYVSGAIKSIEDHYAVYTGVGMAILIWYKRIRQAYQWVRKQLSDLNKWFFRRLREYVIKHVIKMDPLELHKTISEGFSYISSALTTHRELHDRQYSEMLSVLNKQDELLQRVAKETLPNGGEHSISDKLDRILIASKIQWDSSEHGGFETGRDGRYKFVSSAYCDITGRSREDLLGWGFISTIYEPEQSEMRELIEEGVKDRRKFDIQYTIQRRDGSLVKVAHYWQPMFRNFDIEDEFYGFMGRIVTLES